MPKITSLTKHVGELEKKPDALPAVNSRLQGRAVGEAPGPVPQQSTGTGKRGALMGRQQGKDGPSYTASVKA